MKLTKDNVKGVKFGALVGALALCVGLGFVTPVRAQDRDHRDRVDDHHVDDHDRRDRIDVRYDTEAIRRERGHLRDLQRRRDDRRAHHDWDAVHRLDKAIADTQWRIDHHRFDRTHDWDTFYTDRDREWFTRHH